MIQQVPVIALKRYTLNSPLLHSLEVEVERVIIIITVLAIA